MLNVSHAAVPRGIPDEDDVLRGCSQDHDGHYPLWRSDAVLVDNDAAVLGQYTAVATRFGLVVDTASA